MRASEASRRLDKIVQADPANLRKLGRFTRSGQIDAQFNHHIYVLLVLIPVLTALSIVFYILAGVDGLINGTPDDEVDSIIQGRIQDIVK